MSIKWYTMHIFTFIVQCGRTLGVQPHPPVGAGYTGRYMMSAVCTKFHLAARGPLFMQNPSTCATMKTARRARIVLHAIHAARRGACSCMHAALPHACMRLHASAGQQTPACHSPNNWKKIPFVD
eukprot:365817-Chlamydomonas_euryale.AAC.3